MAHISCIDNCHGVQFDFNSNDAMVSSTTFVAFHNWRPGVVGFWLVSSMHHFLFTERFNLYSLVNSGTFYSVRQFIQLRDNPVEVAGGYNISSLVNEYLAKKETWLVLSIICGIIFLIIALIVIFLRKRIVIAIALVKEGSKYV